MCALTAAQRGRRVIVLEKSNKVGKKILMSGGGRCNFTNYVVESDNFISNNPHFCKSALNGFTQWDFLAMVDQHEIEYEERKHSQLFCVNSAKDILAMLLRECDKAGVTIQAHCDVRSIENLTGRSEIMAESENRNRYKVAYSKKSTVITLESESVVVATGALSIPTLGGSGKGYDIANQFGLTVVERRAGLVPFMFSDATLSMCERLSGVAIEVDVSCQGHQFTENLLFTHRGMSGPATLQISNYWRPGDEVLIDLLPNRDATEWLLEAKSQHGKSLLKTQLNKILPNALVAELQSCWWSESGNSPLAEFKDKQLQEIGKSLNRWVVKPSATEGYRTAEVTLGGVDTDGVSSKTMEVKQQQGLYFVGEVLDVTGHLGGFNFQWAWSSGYCAGSYA
ncbi:MAG: NAD(P)/FAD-dependent oxidoreductase [Pseudomonadales bacterium]|nr:NAD(P)/FAD-dependent oxidoreductase [Pseudomonadales bacterium]